MGVRGSGTVEEEGETDARETDNRRNVKSKKVRILPNGRGHFFHSKGKEVVNQHLMASVVFRKGNMGEAIS